MDEIGLVCAVNISSSAFFDCCSQYTFPDPLQDSLDAPMRLIGVYIAVVSSLCSLAMGLDAAYGFQAKRLWLTSKLFSLNSFSLTFLAVVTKVQVDLSGKLIGLDDKVARVTGLAFMSSAMANFMTSLGTMEDNEILLNMASLCVLVITIAVNVIIRNVQMSSFGTEGGGVLVEEILCAGLMILVLVILCSLSVMVPALKKLIESSYQKVHSRSVSNMQVEWGNFNIDELKRVVTRYWVMVQTGSPQFVIARSATCVIPGILCLFLTCLTPILFVRLSSQPDVDYSLDRSSNYVDSAVGILTAQMAGVVFASIAPVFRWLTASHLKSQKKVHELKDELEVEPYCTQKLLEWENIPFPQIVERLFAIKFAYSTRRVFLKFCIAVQVVIVLISKLLLLVSAVCAKLFLFCSCFSNASSDGMVEDISRYAVLLEGEREMPEKTLRNLCKEVDKIMKIHNRAQAPNLIKLLEKSVNFNGVTEFDSPQSREGAWNSWSLPIVTLTSIAAALPNITAAETNELLRGVSEGLKFVRVIEKTLNTHGESAGIGNEAEVVWLKVELQSKWQEIDIREVRQNSRSFVDALRILSDKARDMKENPQSWQVSVVAADAMHRICQTISQDNISQTDEQLFERISVMISDIFSACLTNLAPAIIFMCRSSTLEKREKIVREAARLVAKSEGVHEVLRKHELPELDAEKAAYIEEWRKLIKIDTENPGALAAMANQTTTA